jgi:hypothetical protein
MRPGQAGLVMADGLNPTMANAAREGGERNGVMTALDDFIAGHLLRSRRHPAAARAVRAHRIDDLIFPHNVYFDRERAVEQASDRYLDSVKRGLIDEYYLENEVRLSILARIPGLTPDELTPDAVRHQIPSHGSLRANGLFDPDLVVEFVSGIERALEVRTESAESALPQTTSWCNPLPFPPDEAKVLGRHWVAGSGGILTCD